MIENIWWSKMTLLITFIFRAEMRLIERSYPVKWKECARYETWAAWEAEIGWVGLQPYHQISSTMAQDLTQWYASLTKLNLWQMIKNSSDVEHKFHHLEIHGFQMILKDYKNSVFNISHHRWEKVINQEADYQNSTTLSVPASQHLSLFESVHLIGCHWYLKQTQLLS